MVDLEHHFELFKKEVNNLNSLKSFTNTIRSQHASYKQLLEDNGLITKKDERSDESWSSYQKFLYKNYINGETCSLGTNKFTLKDLYHFELEIKNRQYQFLLLHAFEAFEKYLICAATYAQYIDDEYKCRKFTPISFIQHLHSTIPVIPQYIKLRNKNDPNFSDEISLLLTFSLIEKLRHKITHAHGLVNNKPDFIKCCLDSIGRYNNGNPKMEFIDYINSHFGTGPYENLICLIEIQDTNNPHLFHDRLDSLISELTSYVVLINPFIKRYMTKF